MSRPAGKFLVITISLMTTVYLVLFGVDSVAKCYQPDSLGVFLPCGCNLVLSERNAAAAPTTRGKRTYRTSLFTFLHGTIREKKRKEKQDSSRHTRSLQMTCETHVSVSFVARPHDSGRTSTPKYHPIL